MTSPALLRVILGPDSSQRVVFSRGLPSTLAELETGIKTQCKIVEPFRLQFMDTLFDNKFVNLTATEEIQDKATLKVVHTTTYSQPQDSGGEGFSLSTSTPDDDTSCSGDSTIILSSPASTSSRSSWPELFFVPRFTYDA